MSDLELSDLYENLTLVDEDEAVLEMAEDVEQEGEEDVDRCIVGKVLSGKKVNREAFKGLIEQIWNPYGNVEVELVDDNIFTFHFANKEDMNRVWYRGPWHFAKWLAEQIGEVVEIPAESRECRGKFMRVKVRIDISKALRRWLKLKLNRSEEITMMNLKNERLPEFCFACGKIGHCIRECQDEEARAAALTGSQNKFGSWLKASIPERPRPRFGTQGNESSSDRSRSMEASREFEGDGSISLKQGSRLSQKDLPSTSVGAAQSSRKEKMLLTLPSVREVGAPSQSEMVIDGPEHKMDGVSKNLGLPLSESMVSPPLIITNNTTKIPSIQDSPPQKQLKERAQPTVVLISQTVEVPHQINKPVAPTLPKLSPKKRITKKWKRSAREVKHKTVPMLISNPLQRILEYSGRQGDLQRKTTLPPLGKESVRRLLKGEAPRNIRLLIPPPVSIVVMIQIRRFLIATKLVRGRLVSIIWMRMKEAQGKEGAQ
ncbi:hypothetical protein EZV62_003116 [Acer yangbiense]|uniref:CCHC-type domain-containing protein n=1 Tax=Acer yangbiense TaxID=1000413 RepID=A0A5C7IGB4_9ROSI|nr:hypothetical protein EZV62_003116 [Acer yangbiense]